MSIVNLRALRDEGDYLPNTLDDAIALRRALLDAGVSRALADGAVMWLTAKAAGEPDLTSAPTRSSYRKALRLLGRRPASMSPYIIDLRAPLAA